MADELTHSLDAGVQTKIMESLNNVRKKGGSGNGNYKGLD